MLQIFWDRSASQFSEFQEKVKNSLPTMAEDGSDCMVNVDSTEKSICLAKFLMQHKKYLSGYTTSGVLQQSCLSVPQLAKKILLYPGPTVPCNAITKSTRNTADQVKEQMKSLCELGMGETKHEKPQGGGRLIFTFLKKRTQDMSLENTIELTNTLSKFEIDINSYEEAFNCNSENVPPCKKNAISTYE